MWQNFSSQIGNFTNLNNQMVGMMIGAFGTGLITIIIVLSVISLILKGFALWRAARKIQKVWFVVMLIVNTFGVLEVIYLLTAGKDKK